MSEKQFDQFDEPFRKAAGQFEPEFSEDAWKKMEAKLDGEPKRRKPFGWWWFSDLVMITLVVTLLFEFNSGKPSLTSTPAFTSNTQPGQVDEQDPTKAESIDPKPLHENQPETGSVGLDETRTRENPLPKNSKGTASSAIAGLQKNNNAEQVNTITTDLPDGRPAHTESNNNAPANPGQGALETNERNFAGDKAEMASTTAIETSSPVTDPSQEIPVTSNTFTSAQPSESGSSKKVAANKADSAISPAPASPATTIVKPAKSFKGFYVQAGVAPEWSFITGNKPGPVTAAYGGFIGYQFGSRWSVQAGIFSTRKDYEAGPGDYKAKAGSYYATVKIFHVEADCRITELPLLVNYQVHARKRQSFAATAGFASLIMKKENYDYHYERWNGMPGYSEHSYQTGVFHAFASLYLGGAYGINLNKNLSVSAAPYIKIPLYGVGEGNVKITSAGAMLGLKYALGSRQK